MNDDFLDLLDALLGRGARFLIVGAHALAVHGVARATGDLDLWVEPTKANAALVWGALSDFGAPLATHGVALADFERADTVYQLGLPPTRIDVLTSIDAVGFASAWGDRSEHTVEGRALPFLGRDDLIRNKRAVARPRDLADVERLERASTRE